MSKTQFQPGPDDRRHRGGRPPGSKGIAATIKRVLGPDAEEIAKQARQLAKAGDPQAILACATLLAGAVAMPDRSKPIANGDGDD